MLYIKCTNALTSTALIALRHINALLRHIYGGFNITIFIL